MDFGDLFLDQGASTISVTCGLFIDKLRIYPDPCRGKFYFERINNEFPLDWHRFNCCRHMDSLRTTALDEFKSMTLNTRKSLFKSIWISWLAKIMINTRINQTTIVQTGKNTFLSKKRNCTGELIIVLSNIFFKACDVKIRYLRKNLWFQREKDIYRILYQQECIENDAKELSIPFIRGIDLASIMQSEQYIWKFKKEACAKAISALKQLHGEILSHGSAHVHNVILEENRIKTVWIDFETIHTKGTDLVWRRMDDLRVLLFSIAKYIQEEEHTKELLLLSFSVYRDKEDWDIFAESMRDEKFLPLAFFLARARLDLAEYCRIQLLFQKFMSNIFQSFIDGNNTKIS